MPFFFFSLQSLLQPIVHFTFCISLQRNEMKLSCDAATVQANCRTRHLQSIYLFFQVLLQWKMIENWRKKKNSSRTTRYAFRYFTVAMDFDRRRFYTLLHRTRYNTSLLSIFYFHTRYAFDRRARTHVPFDVFNALLSLSHSFATISSLFFDIVRTVSLSRSRYRLRTRHEWMEWCMVLTLSPRYHASILCRRRRRCLLTDSCCRRSRFVIFEWPSAVATLYTHKSQLFGQPTIGCGWWFRLRTVDLTVDFWNWINTPNLNWIRSVWVWFELNRSEFCASSSPRHEASGWQWLERLDRSVMHAKLNRIFCLFLKCDIARFFFFSIVIQQPAASTVFFQNLFYISCAFRPCPRTNQANATWRMRMNQSVYIVCAQIGPEFFAWCQTTTSVVRH